jgi:hypothetical protein
MAIQMWACEVVGSDANFVCSALGKPKQMPLPRFKGSIYRQFFSAQGMRKVLSADFSALLLAIYIKILATR